MSSKKLSLAEFASKRDVKHVCRVCALPEDVRKELEAGLDSGVSQMSAALWLKSLGHAVGKDSISNHRRAGHGKAETVAAVTR